MASMWMPGAVVMKAPSDAGSMLGGGKKVVWHTTENDPNKTSARNVASYLASTGYSVHLVWNPVTGEIIQTIPANRGGKGLKNSSGGVQTNRGGTYVIQIEVVGKATQPFTSGPCKNLDKILSWLKSLGIPAVFPAGAPKPYPASYGGNRSVTAWEKSGHFGHGQVPENVHGDPGQVDVKKLTTYPGAAVKTEYTGAYTVANLNRILAAAGRPADGLWQAADDIALSVLVHGVHNTPDTTKRLQRVIGANPDGQWGTDSQSRYTQRVKVLQEGLRILADGKMDAVTVACFNRARKQFYHP